MSGNTFYRLDPVLICLALLGLLIAAEEVGFRAMKRTRAGSEKVENAAVC